MRFMRPPSPRRAVLQSALLREKSARVGSIAGRDLELGFGPRNPRCRARDAGLHELRVLQLERVGQPAFGIQLKPLNEALARARRQAAAVAELMRREQRRVDDEPTVLPPAD